MTQEPSPRYVPRRIESNVPHDNMYMNVHSSTSCKAKKGEQPKCLWTDEWINKKWYKYPLPEKGMKYWQKKPDTKGHVLHDPIYIKCPEQANP